MDGFLFVMRLVLGIISLGCFAFVIMKMFQDGESTIAIVCLVGLLCGIGGLVAFGYGWWKVREWEIMPVMGVWTGALVLSVGLAVLQVTMAGA
jgi:hypothetical protein